MDIMEISSWLLFHPFGVAFIGNQIVARTAGFTSSQSSLRPALLALLLAYTCIGLAKYPNYTQNTSSYGTILGMILGVCPLVFFDRLILRQWAFEDRHKIFPAVFAAKTRHKKDDERDKANSNQSDGARVPAGATNDTLGSRVAFGQEVAASSRMVDTPWEAKNVAPFSTRDPSYVPSRASIVKQKLLIVLPSLLVREIIMEVQMSIDPYYFAPSRVSFLTRLNELSREEVAVRMILGIGSWVYILCMIQIMLGMGTIIMAYLKPHEVRKLRPSFGAVSDAYTLRRFWGKFWHQNIRNNIEGPSRFITYSILRLPRGSLLARNSFTFFAFFFSGLVHVVADISMSVPPSQSGAIRFFCTSALGIMLEDGAQEIYRRLNGGRYPKELWSRVIGYVWVVIFLSWSTACWEFPRMRTRRFEDKTFEYGVLRELLGFPLHAKTA